MSSTTAFIKRSHLALFGFINPRQPPLVLFQGAEREC